MDEYRTANQLRRADYKPLTDSKGKRYFIREIGEDENNSSVIEIYARVNKTRMYRLCRKLCWLKTEVRE